VSILPGLRRFPTGGWLVVVFLLFGVTSIVAPKQMLVADHRAAVRRCELVSSPRVSFAAIGPFSLPLRSMVVSGKISFGVFPRRRVFFRCVSASRPPARLTSSAT
jgi:hypothetical protein